MPIRTISGAVIIGKKTLDTLINQTKKKLASAQEVEKVKREEFHRLHLEESRSLCLATAKVRKYTKILQSLRDVKADLEQDVIDSK